MPIRRLPSFQNGGSGGGVGSGRYSSEASNTRVLLAGSSVIPSGCQGVIIRFYRKAAVRANLTEVAYFELGLNPYGTPKEIDGMIFELSRCAGEIFRVRRGRQVVRRRSAKP